MKKITLFTLLLTAGVTLAGVTLAGCSRTTDANGNPASSSGSTTRSEINPDELFGDPTGELNVSCYDSLLYKSFLEEAAKQFEAKYPDTKINVNTFSAMPEIKTTETEDGGSIAVLELEDDPQGRADYISKVSTSLMSGDGADLLAMDVLPAYKYAKNGQLENLAEYMEKDPEFNRADYRENILKGMEFLNGTWILPINYSFDYYAYDSSLLPNAGESFGTSRAFTASELFDLALPDFDGSAKVFPTPAYSQNNGGDYFSQLLSEQYTSFVDMENNTANFDDGTFAALLNTVKEQADQDYIPKNITEDMDIDAIMNSIGEEPTERFFFKPSSNLSLVSQFAREIGLQMSFMAGFSNGIEDHDAIAGIQAEQSGNVPFTYEQAYGINANSDNKALAWAFLKFLLSEEIQSNPSLSSMSLPLHNEARKQQAELMISSFLGGDGSAEQTVLAEKYLQAVEEMSEQITGYTFHDSTIMDMITSEIAYFFEGTKSADEVCKVLQNKVNLYLNE